jgi:hypothetical protein
VPLTRRYVPEKPPEETSIFGADFSFIIPPGVGIASGSLDIWTNTPGNVVDANADWQKGEVFHRGRALYCLLTGGVLGTDYQLRWYAVDTDGNTWPRYTTVLCSWTS